MKCTSSQHCYCNFLLLDSINRLNLKISPTLQTPPLIKDHHVPIFTCTKEDIYNTMWDLTIEQVMKYVRPFLPCGIPRL